MTIYLHLLLSLPLLFLYSKPKHTFGTPFGVFQTKFPCPAIMIASKVQCQGSIDRHISCPTCNFIGLIIYFIAFFLVSQTQTRTKRKKSAGKVLQSGSQEIERHPETKPSRMQRSLPFTKDIKAAFSPFRKKPNRRHWKGEQGVILKFPMFE